MLEPLLPPSPLQVIPSSVSLSVSQALIDKIVLKSQDPTFLRGENYVINPLLCVTLNTQMVVMGFILDVTKRVALRKALEFTT